MAQITKQGETLLLKPESVAHRLQFGRSKTYQLLREGAIPSIRVGGSRRVRARDLERYVERLGTEAAKKSRTPVGYHRERRSSMESVK